MRLLGHSSIPHTQLRRWGMAIQELNIKIEYRLGKTNTRADALSRYTVSLLPSDCDHTQTCKLIAALEANPPAKGSTGA